MTVDDEMIPVIEDRFDGGQPPNGGGVPQLSEELVDELLAGARTPAQITGEGGLLQTLAKRPLERAMDA